MPIQNFKEWDISILIRHLGRVFGVAVLVLVPQAFTQGATDSSKAGSPTAGNPLFFEAKIRPVLLGRCAECHDDTAEGGLRVDSREALLTGGKSGPAIVPGKPADSLLLQAVRHTHAKLRMPKKRNPLPSDEIETLEQWIASGAPWPTNAAPATATRKIDVTGQLDFWSIQPLSKPPIPAVTNRLWPKSDLDRFVLARLEREGLQPVDAAGKRVLIRRATLDMTGLPPTPEEVQSFLSDNRTNAFETVVDRLLASPRYGEMWGRWWLDIARYGEDDCRSLDPMGRGFNPYPKAHAYRDWVIQALNDDMPYDQFVLSQLAGDLMGDTGRAGRLPALGYLGLGPWLYDNGSIEVTRADERHDRIDAISRGLLGLTIGCARCHDHKYDAIAIEDYYSLASVFKNTVYKEYPQVPQSEVDAFAKAEKRMEDLEALVAEHMKAERRHLSEMLALQTSRYMMAAWGVLLDPKKQKSLIAAREKLDFELLDRWISYLGRTHTQYTFLDKWKALVAARGSKEEATRLSKEFQETVVDVMLEHIEIEDQNDIIRAKALPGNKRKKPSKLPGDFITNDDFCPGCGLELKTLQGERNALWIDLFDRDMDYALDLTQGNFDPDRKPGLFVFEDYGLERMLGAERRQQLRELKDELKKLQKENEDKFAYVHGVAEASDPTPIRVHLRGSPFRLGNEAPARFPQLLSQGTTRAFTNGSGRLALAQAIVTHPIAARVIANRVWKWHFGTGLVETPGDLGRTGERPSNPALLEYLSWLFVDGGMSLKKFHKAILLSATYGLSDAANPRNDAVDAANRLHWKFSPRRLSAEQIRDSALFVANTLDLKPGGPSEKLTALGVRRTVYSQISRYKLDPFLALFDFPSPNISAERRFTTQVPLQQLFFMNGEFIQQQAETLAQRVAGETNFNARIQKLYSLLFNRPASEAELGIARRFFETEPLRAYEERKAAADKDPDKDKPKTAASASSTDDKPDSDKPDGASPGSAPGMMAGVGDAANEDKKPKQLLPITLEGRYIKVLLSSHEFLFLR